MNIAGIILLIWMIAVAFCCVKSDWREFKEDDDDDPYDGQNGV